MVRVFQISLGSDALDAARNSVAAGKNWQNRRIIGGESGQAESRYGCHFKDGFRQTHVSQF
jgi:hypothetical protein